MAQALDASSRAGSRAAIVSRGRRALREDAAVKWGVRPGLAEALFVAPLVVAAVAAVAMVRPGLFFFLTDEDSLLEWLQAAALAAAGLLFFAVGVRRWAAGDRARAVGLLAVAGACLFVAGEEISWGQRILGFETPETLGDVNRQEEFTLHNIGVLRVGLKFVAILLGLAGAVLPWLLRGRPAARSLVVPPLFVTPVFFVVFAYNVARAAAYPGNFFRGEGNRPEVFLTGTEWTQLGLVIRYSEWTELGLAYAAFVIALLVWRRGRARAVPASAPPPVNR